MLKMAKLFLSCLALVAAVPTALVPEHIVPEGGASLKLTAEGDIQDGKKPRQAESEVRLLSAPAAKKEDVLQGCVQACAQNGMTACSTEDDKWSRSSNNKASCLQGCVFANSREQPDPNGLRSKKVLEFCTSKKCFPPNVGFFNLGQSWANICTTCAGKKSPGTNDCLSGMFLTPPAPAPAPTPVTKQYTISTLWTSKKGWQDEKSPDHAEKKKYCSDKGYAIDCNSASAGGASEKFSITWPKDISDVWNTKEALVYIQGGKNNKYCALALDNKTVKCLYDLDETEGSGQLFYLETSKYVPYPQYFAIWNIKGKKYCHLGLHGLECMSDKPSYFEFHCQDCD